MPAAVTKRFAKTLAAHGFAQVLAIVVTFVSVPLFISKWGVVRSGEWVALTALPNYLNITDLSFGSTAANEMTMLAGAGKEREAQTVYRSVWVLILGLSAIVSLAVVALVLTLPFDRWLGIQTFTHREVVLSTLLLAGQIVLSQQGSVLMAAFRAGGFYATGLWAGDSLKFVEFLALVAVLATGGGPVLLTGSVLAIRAVSYAFLYLYVRRLVPWLSLGIGGASAATIRPLVGPSLAYCALPLGQATTLQGTVVVAQGIAGAAGVLAFSTTRTVTRLVFQIVSMLTNSTWPEFSRAIGAGDLDLARRLHRRACQVGVWLAILGSAAACLFGPTLYAHWVKGKVPFRPDLFVIMLVVVVLNSFWTVSYAVPLSVNRHQRITYAYLGATLVGLLLSIGLGRVVGLDGIALGLIPVDLIMIAVVLPQSMAILEDVSSRLTLVQPPFAWFWGKLRGAMRRTGASA